MSRREAINRAHWVLSLVKGSFLLGMILLISPLMMSFTLPIFSTRSPGGPASVNTIYDLLFWYVLIIGATAFLFRLAWQAEKTRGKVSRSKLILWDDLVYVIMGMHAGLWYSLLLGSIAWKDFHEPAGSGEVNMMAGITAVFAIIFVVSTAKFVAKLRGAQAIRETAYGAGRGANGSGLPSGAWQGGTSNGLDQTERRLRDAD